MRKKNKLKLALCMMLCALLCLSSVSCSDTDNRAQGKVKVDDYTIVTENGSYYLIFDDITRYDGPNEIASLEFSSIKEWKNAVTQGTLSDHQKTVIATAFPKDDIGILSCDFNNLYAPTMPAGGTVTGVSWSGDTYSFYLECKNSIFGYAHCYTEAQYHDVFQSQYENYFDKDTITVTKTEELDGGQKVATRYSTSAGELMQIRYTLSDADKTVVIDKTYRINMADETLAMSSSVPSNVTLYCVEDSVCYVIDLYDLDQDPADRWLMQFGMARYTKD